MLKFLNSGFAFVLQVLLVVGGMIVFAYFDPLGVFATRTTLKNTPVSEKSIREIGELITAEYYGEVISSLPEEVRAQADTMVSVFRVTAEQMRDDFINAIDELRLDTLKHRKKVIYAQFEEENPDLANHEFFSRYLYYLKRKIDGKPYDDDHIDETLKRGDRESFVKTLYVKQGDPQYDLTRYTTIDDYVAAFKTDTREQTIKKLKKSRLVLLGRGWVKAGFNFGSFTERNFAYHERSGRRTIHFIGLQPSILSATINPWFIPEKRVEGFEIMIATGKARRDYELVGRVKQICLNKLRQQAMDRDILGRAEKNARANLKTFFSLLIEEGDIDEVFFHTNVLDYSLSTLLDDDILRDAELLTLDSVLVRAQRDSNVEDKKEESIAFLDTLRNRTVLQRDAQGKMTKGIEIFGTAQDRLLHRFMALLYQIGEDEILSLAEQDTLRQRVASLSSYEPLDSLWYPYRVDTTQADSLVRRDSTMKRDSTLAVKRGHFDSMMEALRKRITHLGREQAETRSIDGTQDQVTDTLEVVSNDSLEINAWFNAFNVVDSTLHALLDDGTLRDAELLTLDSALVQAQRDADKQERIALQVVNADSVKAWFNEFEATHLPAPDS